MNEAKNISKNKYYLESDGWFNYYVNVVTGEKKFRLDENDVCVERDSDDFYREQAKK